MRKGSGVAQITNLYGVTIIPPAAGFPPMVPEGAQEIVDTLAAIRPPEAHRATSRSLFRRVFDLLRKMLLGQHPTATPAPTPPAPQGLSMVIHSPIRDAIFAYAEACRHWKQRLVATTEHRSAQADWHMTSARNVDLNSGEQILARTLAEAGVVVQSQVGVAKARGGRRRSGWYDNYWLDFAHRDWQHFLRIDIELDGHHHYQRDRVIRDHARNAVLAERGWYVVRISGQVLGQENHRRALAQLRGLIAQHTNAVRIARLELGLLAAYLAPHE